MEYITIRIPKKEIIYDGKVRKTYGGQGKIRLNDRYLGNRAYVIFPLLRKNDGDGTIIAIDEIKNKGVRPNNDHTAGIDLSKKYVGRKCIVVLQEEPITS